MVQVISQEGLGEQLGASLGSGLSQGLQLLAQERMQKLAQQRLQKTTAQGLEAFLSPEEAQKISLLPEPLQKEYIQQRQLQSLLGGGIGEEIPTPTREEAPAKGIVRFSDEQLVGLSGRPGGIGQVAKAELERRKGEKAQSFQEKKLALSETKEFRKNINEQFRNAKEIKNRLNRIREVSEKGDLPTPLVASILEKFPIDTSFLLSADAQEIEKLGLDLTAGLAKDFGNRINITEFKTFLKRVPNIRQTKEGRERILRNMELIQAQPKILRGEASRAIIKEEGGVPADLEEKVEDRVGPQLDELAIQVERGIKLAKRSGEAPSRESTASLKEGYVKVQNPEGVEGQIPKTKLKEALSKGFTRV